MLSSGWKLCSTPTNVDGTRMKNRIQQNGKDKQNVFPYTQVSCNDFPVLPLHDVFLYLEKNRERGKKLESATSMQQKMVTRKQMWTLGK